MSYKESLIKDVRKYKKFIVYGEVEEVSDNFIIISDTTGKLEIKLKDNIELKEGEKVRVFGHWEEDIAIVDLIQKMNLGVYLYNKYQKLVKKLFKEEEE